MSNLQVKAMIIIFLDIGGILLTDWVPESQTVNQKYCLEILTKLQERIWKKRPELWKMKSWILHQDNALPRKLPTMKQFLVDKCIPVLKHTQPLFTGFSLLCIFFCSLNEKCVERNSFSECQWSEI
jgi:hypothetical protein